MRILGILSLASFVAYFIPMEASYQEKLLTSHKEDQKFYINAEHLYFGNEGIFLRVNHDKWLPVSSINHDSEGIYLTRGGISWEYAVCKKCNRHYQEPFPTQCDTCGGREFDYVYNDIYDRNS